MTEDEIRREALASLEKELQSLEAQLTKLDAIRVRRDQLFGTVTQLRFTLGLGHYVAPTLPEPGANADPFRHGLHPSQMPASNTAFLSTPPTPPPAPQKPPIWEAARNILSQADEPMTLGEICDALNGLAYVVMGRPGRETVRAILHKKKDVFERLSEGKYRLK